MQHLVIGCGISGLGAIELLITRGFPVCVYDQKQPPDSILKQLNDLNVTYLQTVDAVLALQNLERAVVSPGFPPSHPLLVALTQRKIPIMSELDLVFLDTPRPIIAVTGTNGKSTTTALIYHILQELGVPSSLGGNIGTSVAALAAHNDLKGICVLELSSYQIYYTQKLSITSVVITNLTPDHIAWHGSLTDYYQSKAKLIKFIEKSSGTLVLTEQAEDVFKAHNIDHYFARTLILTASIRNKLSQNIPDAFCLLTDKDILLKSPAHRWSIPTDNLRIKGSHNRENAAMALAAVVNSLEQLKIYTLPTESALTSAINSFPGLAHRYQVVGSWRNLTVINDSKATNVDATITALKSSPERAYLLLGGRPKGELFLPLLEFKNTVHAIFAFGEARDEIFHQLHDKIKVYSFDSLDVLLKRLPHMTYEKNSRLLLSPGCASFDEFNNFEHRGEFFCETMRDFINKNL